MGSSASHNERRRPPTHLPLPRCLRGRCPGRGSAARPCGPSGSPCPSQAHTLSGPQWHSQHCVPAEAGRLSVPAGPSRPPPWSDTLRARDGSGSRGPAGFQDQMEVTPSSWETPGPSPTTEPPTCHTPTIALATRISMMTRGSTKAVVVSSSSSNQARTCRDQSW